jgi:guanylate kinase
MSNESRSSRPEPGLLLVVSSPSGAGKTTLSRKLRDEFPNLGFSVSYTTRTPRRNETDGRDYHFVDDETFDEMIRREKLAEWAEVHGNRYGTAYEAVREALESGKDMIFDIDYQGGHQLKERFPEAVMVFVLPPSMDVLTARLRGRKTDSRKSIELRLRGAVEELGHYDEYDYLVVNDELEEAYQELRSIYLASLCAARRRGRKAKELLRQAKQEIAE